MRKTKRDWFIEGINILSSGGAGDLTIDALTGRLEVTKGSFYHHFKNIQDFKENLLVFIEQEGTLQVIQITEQATTPLGKLERLLEITVNAVPNLEVALRAWALQDPLAKATQERIDVQRIAYVKTLCEAVVHDANKAELMAQMFYVVYVGSQQVLPPIQGEDRQRLYRELVRHYGLDTH